MRILHIITSLELGGAEKLLVDMVELQREKGQYVDVLVLYDKENDFYIPGAITSKYNSKTSYKNIFEILKVIKKGKYNIVHSHLTHAQVWTSLVTFLDFSQYFKMLSRNKSKNTRVYITTEHSTFNNRRGKNIYRVIERVLYSRFSRIVSISKGVQESLIQWLKMEDKTKFLIIENGIFLENFYSSKSLLKSDFGLSEEDKVIVMIARLNDPKDHETLLKAMNLLPKKYKLLLVGDGPKLELLKSLSSQLKVANRVNFLGTRNDIGSILKTSDIAVQSSNFEGFGLAAVEAMAAGVPVIASDVEGLRDVVSGAGVLFKKGDAKELAKKILEIDSDKNLKGKIIEEQFKRSNSYSLEKSIDKYLILYKRELEKKG